MWTVVLPFNYFPYFRKQITQQDFKIIESDIELSGDDEGASQAVQQVDEWGTYLITAEEEPVREILAT